MELKHRAIIDNFKDVLVENTDFKKVYTVLLRNGILPVTLKAFENLSKRTSDKEMNEILYNKVIKSRGHKAFSEWKLALLISNQELWNQVFGRPWTLTNELWHCSPQVYDLNNAKICGQYLIVTHTENRPGWECEVEKLKTTFDFLQYEGSVCEDPTPEELDDKLSAFTKHDAGCYVLALAGHGCVSQGRESILLANKSYKEVNEIVSKFCKSRSLFGKPKVVILQMCRGDEESISPSDGRLRTAVDMLDIKDTIILKPCLPGFVAYRDVSEGGWFIIELTSMIRKHARMKDIEEIMIEVSKNLLKENSTETRRRYMIPCVNTYSFKKFYFLPKEDKSLQGIEGEK